MQTGLNLVPGMASFNNAAANFNQGSYGAAAAWGVAAIVEPVATVLTGGGSALGKTAAQSGAEMSEVRFSGRASHVNYAAMGLLA